jgi:hypothetical protein
MKRILTLFLWVITVPLLAQNPLITGIVINLPPFPDPNTANWGTGSTVFTISATTSANYLKEVMSSSILVGIRKGESKVCGTYTAATAPASNFNRNTMVWAGKNAVGLMGQECILPPGEYELCVQFFLKGRKISEGICKSFTIMPKEEISYQGPGLISPDDGKVLKADDLKKPLTFRWIPVTPKPRDAVNYSLRIFEIRQGQTASSAVKGAIPLLEKEISNQTQFILPSFSQMNIARGSSYGWYVRATDPKGSPLGSNDGMSEVYTLKSGDNINIEIDSLNVSCCVNGNQNVYLKINNLHLSNAALLSSIKYRINGTGPLTNLTPVAPALPVTIPANGSQVFTGSLSCIDSMSTIKFIVGAAWPGDPDNINNETAWDTLQCPCDPCREINVTISNDAVKPPKNGSPVQVNLVGSFIGLNANLISKVTAEIIYFNITQTEDPNCAKCVYDSRYYGNFYPPASALPGYTGPLFNRPDYTRLVTWNSTVFRDCGETTGGTGHDGDIDPAGSTGIREADVVNTNQAARKGSPVIAVPAPQLKPPHFILPIAVPEMNSLDCCGDKITICIRYTFYDFCCQACEVIKCYEITRGK